MSRKAEKSAEERPNKRQCVSAPTSSRAPAVINFDDINDDVLVKIMSFLEIEELNDATLINSRFNEARNHPSLDQTRTATIVISSENITVLDLYEMIASRCWTRTFAENSNNTCLKIVGLEKLQRLEEIEEYNDLGRRAPQLQLPSVTCVDLSSSRDEQHRARVGYYDIAYVARLLPSLRQVDLSYVRAGGAVIAGISQSSRGRNLACIKWNRAERACLAPPFFTAQHATDLTELYLDDAQITGLERERDMFSTDSSDHEHYLWMHCGRLERLSMKNASWELFPGVTSPQPFSQDMLIKMVRHHPTLRWLRSDLTAENVAMLKREKPEITFVSE